MFIHEITIKNPVNLKGHQTSGAQAPDFWCPGTKTLVPPTLFGVFSHQCMLISCWQCSNITRFRVKHMKTLGKQDKFIFLMPSLEIKTKNYCSAWKGTKILVPGHQNSGAPAFFRGVSDQCMLILCWQCSNITRFCVKHIKTLDKQEKFIFLKPILEIKTENLLVSLEGHQTSGARSPELWCPQQYVLDFHSRRSQGPVFRSIKWAHIDQISLQKNAGAPEVWCPFKLTNSFWF